MKILPNNYIEVDVISTIQSTVRFQLKNVINVISEGYMENPTLYDSYIETKGLYNNSDTGSETITILFRISNDDATIINKLLKQKEAYEISINNTHYVDLHEPPMLPEPENT